MSSNQNVSEVVFCVVQSEYVALYTYESPEPGDLTFREGDVILVTQREGEWWSGGIGDRTGVFPSNYVKPKETDVRRMETHAQCTATCTRLALKT